MSGPCTGIHSRLSMAEMKCALNCKPYPIHIFTGFNPEVTWVTKRYLPLDERTYAPVPRHKYMLRPSGVPPPAHWIPPRPDSDPEVAKFSKLRDQSHSYR